jgi:predicted RNA-binding protein YlxR (DUF448 family)
MHKPIRMCIACRNRFYKENLIRLQCAEGEIHCYKNSGRSFYLCDNCLDTNKSIKALSKKCKKSKDTIIKQLKEIIN